jgi:hypothetical protein
MTLPVVAPFVPNDAQMRFLRFHVRYLVTSWRWHFVGTQLRAHAEGGQSATIWRDDIEQLVVKGLMRWGVGCADCSITLTGRELVST